MTLIVKSFQAKDLPALDEEVSIPEFSANLPEFSAKYQNFPQNQ